jgi:hypothetical protein
VPDLQPHVPKAIKNSLGDLLAPGGLLVGQDEQQIDIGFRRHQPAAIAAGGDDRHALGTRGRRRLIEMAGRRGEQDTDDFILHEAQPFGAVPAVTILQQQCLRDGARRNQFGLQELRGGGAEQVLASGMRDGERVHRGADPCGVETFVGLRLGLCYNIIHQLPGYRTALTLSRDILDERQSHDGFRVLQARLFSLRGGEGGIFASARGLTF